MTSETLLHCSECGENFFNPHAFVLEDNKYHISIDHSGIIDWSTSEVVEGTAKHVDVECPNCNTKLYSGELNYSNMSKVLWGLRVDKGGLD